MNNKTKTAITGFISILFTISASIVMINAWIHNYEPTYIVGALLLPAIFWAATINFYMKHKASPDS